MDLYSFQSIAMYNCLKIYENGQKMLIIYFLLMQGKSIGNVNLAAVAAAGPADAAATGVELNRIITAINAVPTPDCRD